MFENLNKLMRGKTGDEYPHESLQEALNGTTEDVDVVRSNHDIRDDEEIDRGG